MRLRDYVARVREFQAMGLSEEEIAQRLGEEPWYVEIALKRAQADRLWRRYSREELAVALFGGMYLPLGVVAMAVGRTRDAVIKMVQRRGRKCLECGGDLRPFGMPVLDEGDRVVTAHWAMRCAGCGRVYRFEFNVMEVEDAVEELEGCPAQPTKT